MQEYVVGFMFDKVNKRVALIRKTKPNWQAGLVNGVGGKIEDGETPEQAMVREFEEETGVHAPHWDHFLSLRGTYFRVHFYMSNGELNHLKTTTEEEIVIRDVADISDAVPNLHWIIPMALNISKEKVNWFDVTEQ